MDVDSVLSKGLLDTLADLELPKLPKYTEGEAFITKILKDKQKLRKQNEKREKQEEAFRQRLAEDDDGLEEAEEAAAKKARFEESKATLQEKIKAQAGPPVFKQALFPAEVPPAESLLNKPAESEVSAACLQVLGNDADRATMIRELLLGGWLHQYYTQQGSISASLQRDLFTLTSQSSDIEVARKAYEILIAVYKANLQGDRKPYTGLYQQSRVRAAPCLLTDADFLRALSAVGAGAAEAPKGRAGKRQAREQEAEDKKENEGEAGEPSDIIGWPDAKKPPRFHNLQLLLRLLATVSKMQAAGLADTLNGAGAAQLLLTLLSLHLDPACNLLSIDLEAAAAALIEAIPASDWTRKFPDLAAQVASLGCSHRGAVEVIRLLGSLGPRANLLRTHAIAHLLPNLLLVKGAQAAKPAKSRGEPQAIDPEVLVGAQPWFEDGLGYNKLAKMVRQGNVSIWELRSTIELVDILLWPYVKASKESREELGCKDFVAKWHLFCQKLGNHMNKDNEGAALKLLITTIITRNNPSCV